MDKIINDLKDIDKKDLTDAAMQVLDQAELDTKAFFNDIIQLGGVDLIDNFKDYLDDDNDINVLDLFNEADTKEARLENANQIVEFMKKNGIFDYSAPINYPLKHFRQAYSTYKLGHSNVRTMMASEYNKIMQWVDTNANSIKEIRFFFAKHPLFAAPLVMFPNANVAHHICLCAQFLGENEQKELRPMRHVLFQLINSFMPALNNKSVVGLPQVNIYNSDAKNTSEELKLEFVTPCSIYMSFLEKEDFEDEKLIEGNRYGLHIGQQPLPMGSFAEEILSNNFFLLSYDAWHMRNSKKPEPYFKKDGKPGDDFNPQVYNSTYEQKLKEFYDKKDDELRVIELYYERRRHRIRPPARNKLFFSVFWIG